MIRRGGGINPLLLTSWLDVCGPESIILTGNGLSSTIVLAAAPASPGSGRAMAALKACSLCTDKGSSNVGEWSAAGFSGGMKFHEQEQTL
jgi:hypothetical protein